MKMQEIRTKAKEMGINSFGKTKAELIRSIQKAEGNFECYGTATTHHCDQMECCFRTSCLDEGLTPQRTKTKRRKAGGD